MHANGLTIRGRIAILLFSPLLFFCLLRLSWTTLKITVWPSYREVNRALTYVRQIGSCRLEGKYSIVYYPDGEERAARIVLRAAEKFIPEVAAVFGVTLHRRVPVTLYPNQQELNRAFGWLANEGTMGVYWAGTISVLSPRAWIPAQDEAFLEETFLRDGPIAHEATHLVVDYLTRGNCPRWLTEGLAQEVEWRLTGFLFPPPQSFCDWYSFGALEDFDALADQRLAYYQSFLMVRYLLREVGPEGMKELLSQLGRGISFAQALCAVTGYHVGEFEERFRQSSEWGMLVGTEDCCAWGSAS